MNQRPSITRTVFGISLMIFASTLVGVAQDEGVKQIQQLIKKANSVVESITDAGRKGSPRRLQEAPEGNGDSGQETCCSLDTIQ